MLSGGAIDVDRAEIVEREDGGRSVLLPHFQEIACRLVCLVGYVVADLDEMRIRADAVFFCSVAMYPLSRACEDCELVGPVMTAIRRCPNDMRYCVAIIPPVQLSMPTPGSSLFVCDAAQSVTYRVEKFSLL